jgi:hypothetical protein
MAKIKVRIPEIIDLGCNGKAKVMKYKRGYVLLSYDTPIAFVSHDKLGLKVAYRLYSRDLSNTTCRHWTAFCNHLNCKDWGSKKVFDSLPWGEIVEC